MPDHLRYRGYVLCPGCSRGLHADHDQLCQCDLHEPEGEK